MRFFIKNKILSRFFNEIIDHGEFLEKRSIHKLKLFHEYHFFNAIPDSIKSFFPPVHGFNEKENFSHYFIKKIPESDASYLLINPLTDDLQIIEVIMKLSDYLSKLPSQEVSPDEYSTEVTREISFKNIERLAETKKLSIADELVKLCQSYGYRDMDDYITQLNQKIESEIIQENQPQLYFSHGDLCFSNMLLKDNQLFLIDPKGAMNPKNNYRPIHYELAKISQSLLGGYDLLNHELFELSNNRIKLASIDAPQSKKQFETLITKFGSTLKTIRLVEASLFVSLLPFHQESEKKMRGFLINSLNISAEYL